MSSLKTQYLAFPDIKIAYREYGAGPNLILLHGNSGSKSMFKNYQLKYFGDFHTFAIDSRGHGQSISNDSQYSIEQYSCDVIAFCRALKLEKACVVGYSDGGNIALFLALQAPELFQKIVAISPNYLASGGTDGSLELTKRVCRFLVFLKRLGINTTRQLMRFDLMLNDIGLYENDLQRIRTSLRILYAEKDMIKEEHILDIHRNIPGSTLGKIMKCSHITIPSRKETVADIREYFAA
jgi:pimeloyl-ACP methyl ester carboxylesterase